MKQTGHNGADLARETGLAPANISRYLKGRIPAAEELLKISRACGVTMEWLLTGEDAVTERRAPALMEDAVPYRTETSEQIKKALASTGEELEKLAKLFKEGFKP